MIAAAGFARVDFTPTDRRRRGDPLGLEALNLPRLTDLGHVCAAGAGGLRPRPRGRLHRNRSDDAAAAGARAAAARQADVAPRRARPGGPRRGDRPARARPTSSSASSSPPDPTSSAPRSRSSWRSCRTAWRRPIAPPPSRRSRRRSARRSTRLFIEFGEPVAAASIAQVHKATRARRRRRARGRGQAAAAGRRAAISRATSPTCSTPRAAPSGSSRGCAACAWSRWSRRWRAASRWRWTSVSKRRRLPNSPKTSPTIRASARRRSTGTAPRAKR